MNVIIIDRAAYVAVLNELLLHCVKIIWNKKL